jgi:hypothetical protein
VDHLCDYLDTALGRKSEHPPAQGTEQAVAPAAPLSIDAAHLRLLEVELARHIGPVAGHLVRRAVQSGGDLDALAHRLAPEIDGESERRAFLEACWRIGKHT